MDCHRSFDKVKYYFYCKAVKKPSQKKLNLPVNGVFKLLLRSGRDMEQNRYFEEKKRMFVI